MTCPPSSTHILSPFSSLPLFFLYSHPSLFSSQWFCCLQLPGYCLTNQTFDEHLKSDVFFEQSCCWRQGPVIAALSGRSLLSYSRTAGSEITARQTCECQDNSIQLDGNKSNFSVQFKLEWPHRQGWWNFPCGQKKGQKKTQHIDRDMTTHIARQYKVQCMSHGRKCCECSVCIAVGKKGCF